MSAAQSGALPAYPPRSAHTTAGRTAPEGPTASAPSPQRLLQPSADTESATGLYRMPDARLLGPSAPTSVIIFRFLNPCRIWSRTGRGKSGLFLGCSAYPACDYLKPLQPQQETKIIKELEQTCPQCGHNLLLKQRNFGMFIGCSNYPACHFIVHEEVETVGESLPCPECSQGELVARRGRQGKYFYGCNRYPQCKFTLSQEPHAIPCPQCGYPLSHLKNNAKNDRTFICANKSCRHIFEIES